ncbi:unnamed protein product [Dicrocoelium dendriticum]|nr:unnamed protein product [Dicrocoelium dendriticum]
MGAPSEGGGGGGGGGGGVGGVRGRDWFHVVPPWGGQVAPSRNTTRAISNFCKYSYFVECGVLYSCGTVPLWRVSCVCLSD